MTQLSDHEHVKVITQTLQEKPNRSAYDMLVREHPRLEGIWVDRRGYVWTSIKGTVYDHPLYYLKRLPVYKVTRNRKVRVYNRAARKHQQVSVARIVLEAWVGEAVTREAYRIPFPEDRGSWPFPEAPEVLHWSRFHKTDDISIYLDTPQIFDRYFTWPATTEWDWVPVPLSGGRVKRVPRQRDRYMLRAKYFEAGHPRALEGASRGILTELAHLFPDRLRVGEKSSPTQLTEVNQAPILPLPPDEVEN